MGSQIVGLVLVDNRVTRISGVLAPTVVGGAGKAREVTLALVQDTLDWAVVVGLVGG